MAPPAEAKANFVVVGCGLPGRGMGWFHAMQLHGGVCESARLVGVVRLFFAAFGALPSVPASLWPPFAPRAGRSTSA